MKFQKQKKLVFGAKIRIVAALGKMVTEWDYGDFRGWPCSVS